MPFWNRSKPEPSSDQDQALAAPAPRAAPPPSPPTPAAVDDIGDLDVDTDDPAEAKAVVAELRLRKQDLMNRKKELTLEIGEENARWRERRAGRLRGVPRGGVMGTIVQSSRRSEAMDHANRVNQLTRVRMELDDRIKDIDDDIVRLRRVAGEGKAASARTATKPAGSAIDDLRKLGELRDAGILTEEEFAAKKADLLSRL